MDALGQRPKSRAIRSTPAQFALLKAAYAVSCAPSNKAIAELSQQTGLPEKWITSWFGRQRTKSRKYGEVIDMTMGPSVSTSDCNVSKTDTSLEPVKQQDVASLPSENHVSCSSSPASADQGAILTTKVKSKKSRRPALARHGKSKPKAILTIKPEPREETLPGAGTSTPITLVQAPQLLPSVLSSSVPQPLAQSSVMQSRLPVPPATRSGVVSHPQFGSIYPKNTTENAVLLPASDIRSTTGCISVPLHNGHGAHVYFKEDRSNSGHQKLSEVYTGPPASLHISEPEFQQASPATSLTELVGSLTQSSHSSITPASLTAQQGFLRDRQALLNVHSQALAAYIAMHNRNPAVYRAMLMNYATLFPGLFPTTPGDLAVSGPSSGVLETLTGGLLPVPNISGSRDDFKDKFPSNSPGLPPPLSWEGGLDDPRTSCGFPSIKQEGKEIFWQSNSDYLDFSGLHYDYAPLSHLQERLQPFRLPESEYLFGREAVVNHLLEERLVAEEPFQAAMGLVLLSNLGLRW